MTLETMKHLLQLSICLLIAVQVDGGRQLRIETVPKNVRLSDQRCSTYILGNGTFRGVKFDNQSRSCEPLSEDWFSNPTFEGNNFYFKLQMMEITFKPTLQLETEKPVNVVFGSSILFNIVTDEYTYTGRTRISLGTQDDDRFCYYVDFQNNVNRVEHNNYISTYGYGQYVDVYKTPLQAPYTEYEVELKFTDSLIKVYVDDEHISDFAHRQTFSDCNVLKYDNYNTATSVSYTLHRLRFYYPV